MFLETVQGGKQSLRLCSCHDQHRQGHIAAVPLGAEKGLPLLRTEVLELLETTNDLDVKIACLRYFGKYPSTDILPLLRRFAQPENPWELQAVTMYVLGAYPAANAFGLLKTGLHSPYWHVRRNAATSLVRTVGDSALRSELEQEEDPYAGQILRYCLERDKQTGKEVQEA